MSSSSATSDRLGVLLLGTLLGATIGILFAPNKGTKTRKVLFGSNANLKKKLNKAATKEAKIFKKQVKKNTKALKNKAAEMEVMVDEKFESAAATLTSKINKLVNTNANLKY